MPNQITTKWHFTRCTALNLYWLCSGFGTRPAEVSCSQHFTGLSTIFLFVLVYLPVADKSSVVAVTHFT